MSENRLARMDGGGGPERTENREQTPVRMTKRELRKLLEYSTTLPTGTTIGKRWKRNLNWSDSSAEPEWILGEYIPDPNGVPGMVGTRWSPIEITDRPASPSPTTLPLLDPDMPVIEQLRELATSLDGLTEALARAPNQDTINRVVPVQRSIAQCLRMAALLVPTEPPTPERKP